MRPPKKKAKFAHRTVFKRLFSPTRKKPFTRKYHVPPVPMRHMPRMEHDPDVAAVAASRASSPFPKWKREVKSEPNSRSSSVSAVMRSRSPSARLSDGSEAMYHDDLGNASPRRSLSRGFHRSRSRAMSLSDAEMFTPARASPSLAPARALLRAPVRASRARGRTPSPARAAVAAPGRGRTPSPARAAVAAPGRGRGRSLSRDIIMRAEDLVQGPVGVVNVLNDIIHGRTKRAWRRSVGFLTDKLFRLRRLFGRPFTKRRR